MTAKKIEKIIKADGWVCVRIEGSHHQYRKEGVSKTITVPFHSGKDIRLNIIKNLEKETGLSLRR